jgi:4-hydroxy-tetrahydrodipicolinate synthase
MKTKFEGIFPVLAMPFDEKGWFDEESMRRLVEFQIRSGVHGVVIFGLASEVYKLTDDERKTILRVVVDQVRGRIPIIAGAEHTGTEAAVQRSKTMEDLGANGLMLTPPSLIKPDADGIFDYYKAVSDGVRIPIMIQDAPTWTGVTLPPPLLVHLIKEIEWVQYVKVEAPPTGLKMSRIIESGGHSVSVFGGYGGMYFMEELRRGMCGSLPGCAFPEVFIRMYNLFKKGQGDEAERLFQKYLPLLVFQLASLDVLVEIQKIILQKGGIFGSTYVRKPAIPIDGITRKELDKHLEVLPLAILSEGS